MSETTNIAWADSTFNPFIGCTKVGPGCYGCYAEALMDKRMGRVKWGAGEKRQRTSEAYWRQPLAWDRKARKFPSNTCGASRYLHELAGELEQGNLTLVEDDPRGVAAHIYTVITALYEARSKLEGNSHRGLRAFGPRSPSQSGPFNHLLAASQTLHKPCVSMRLPADYRTAVLA